MRRNIDVALVRSFIAVVETGSVTAAANILGLTQAAISQQIKRLEDLFANPLFRREHRRLVPTPSGERFLASARRLIALNDEIMEAMAAPDFSGEVRLGVPHDIISTYLPAVLRRFDRAWPRVNVTLYSSTSPLLIEKLRRGELDLTLTTERDCPPDAERLVPDQLVWAGAPRGSAFERRPLPVSLGSDTCMFRPYALEALAGAGLDWRPVCQVSEMGPLVATLEADLAIAPMMRSVIPAPLIELPASAGLPALPEFSINLRLRGDRSTSDIAEELAKEIRAGFQQPAARRQASEAAQ